MLELEKTPGCSKGCWCLGRPFDKLRVTGRERDEGGGEDGAKHAILRNEPDWFWDFFLWNYRTGREL
jgi:hypothetical protein